MARAIDPQSSMAALFGTRVRKLREAAGLTQTEVGVLTHVVGSRINQIERATGAKPTLELTRHLDRELVADDLTAAAWRSSSHSNQEGGNCVQVADGFSGAVPVRDSKNPGGPALVLSATAWTAFISGIATR